jgi:hypothetical protein
MPSKITPNKRSAYIHLSEELMIEVFKVDSWEDLNEQLWKYSRDSTLNWVTDTTYRGLDRDYGNLKTSLQRLGGNLKIKEQKLLNAFRKHARTDLQFGESDWDVMLLGRHYGLPTRLLDWTVSPLTALFFAVEHVEHDDEDGVSSGATRIVYFHAIFSHCSRSIKAQRLASRNSRKGSSP